MWNRKIGGNMDILVEILLEIYMELMLLIVPEKNLSKKHIFIAKILAVLVLVGMLALVVWGNVLILDHGNMLGVIPITVAGVISLAQIVGGILLYKRHHY